MNDEVNLAVGAQSLPSQHISTLKPPTTRGDLEVTAQALGSIRYVPNPFPQSFQSGRWFTLGEVAIQAECPEVSASARIRELSKKGIPHEKRREDGGL